MSHAQPFSELFADRRTIRNYKPEPLSEGDADRIVEAGRRAPTGGLGQIYSVIRVTDAALRDRLATLSGNQEHIRVAAEFFVYCLDLYRTQRLIEHKGGSYGKGPHITVHYGTMDALLVAANMATAAEALGYGTCYIGAVLNNLDKVARELQLPKGVVPIVGLTIGVPDERPSPKARLQRDVVFHENTYREPTSADLDAAFGVMGGNWLKTLNGFFGPGGRLHQRERVWTRTLIQQGFEIFEGADGRD
jgi:FMN reductase (NADPH)